MVGYGCFDEGQALIQEAIQRHRLNRVVVAGCSHRTHESLFQRTARQSGLNPYLMEMVNIREHCAWVHSAYPQAATEPAGTFWQSVSESIQPASSTTSRLSWVIGIGANRIEVIEFPPGDSNVTTPATAPRVEP